MKPDLTKLGFQPIAGFHICDEGAMDNTGYVVAMDDTSYANIRNPGKSVARWTCHTTNYKCFLVEGKDKNTIFDESCDIYSQEDLINFLAKMDYPFCVALLRKRKIAKI